MGCSNHHSGHCSGCHCKKKNCDTSNGSTLLKFSGRTGVGSVSSTAYLADPGTGSTVLALLVDPLYPIGEPLAIRTLAVNLLTATPPGVTLVVEVLKNGASLATPLLLNYGGVNPLSGQQRLTLSPSAQFAVGDTLSLRVITTGLLTSPLDLSATLTAKQ